MHPVFVALLLLIGTSSVSAQAPHVKRIDIVDYGIYESTIAKRIESSSLAGGSRSTVTKIMLKERISTILGRRGLQFGFRFMVVGEPKGAPVKLKSITRFPAQGMRKPNTQNTSYRDEYTTTVKVGSADFRGYSFDNDWEIVPGVWAFEFWDGDRKLVEKQFTVVKP